MFVEAIAIFGIFPYVAPLLEERGGGRTGGGRLRHRRLCRRRARLFRARDLDAQTPRHRPDPGQAAASSPALALIVLGLGGDWQLDAAAMLLMGLGFYMLHNTFQAR